jgi:hypothetical protein
VSGEACGATDRGWPWVPPWGPEGPERPSPRPQDPEDPPADERGQPPCPTRTHRLGITATCPLGCVSHPCAGKASDQRLAERAGAPVPPGSGRDQEQGWEGVFLPGITRFHPQNTPRGGERTPPEQATHRRLSAISSRSEHAMGGVKRESMGQDNIRLVKDGLRDCLMESCGGLPHFRLPYRPWHSTSS